MWFRKKGTHKRINKRFVNIISSGCAAMNKWIRSFGCIEFAYFFEISGQIRLPAWEVRFGRQREQSMIKILKRRPASRIWIAHDAIFEARWVIEGKNRDRSTNRRTWMYRFEQTQIFPKQIFDCWMEIKNPRCCETIRIFANYVASDNGESIWLWPAVLFQNLSTRNWKCEYKTWNQRSDKNSRIRIELRADSTNFLRSVHNYQGCIITDMPSSK